MSEYVPDTETVREQYTREQPPHIGTVSEKRAEFDRCLRQVKAEAWDEGVSALLAAHRWNNAEPWIPLVDNPYESQETP